MLSGDERMSILEQRMIENRASQSHFDEEYVRLYGEWYRLWAERETQKEGRL